MWFIWLIFVMIWIYCIYHDKHFRMDSIFLFLLGLLQSDQEEIYKSLKYYGWWNSTSFFPIWRPEVGKPSSAQKIDHNHLLEVADCWVPARSLMMRGVGRAQWQRMKSPPVANVFFSPSKVVPVWRFRTKDWPGLFAFAQGIKCVGYINCYTLYVCVYIYIHIYLYLYI